MRDSMINTCGMNMRKLLEKKSEVLVQKYGVRNVELEILLFLYHSSCGDTAKDIVEQKNLSKAHISKSVDNLRTKGFVVLIEDEKVYLEEWVEEGWDEEKDCATDAYQYYNKIIIKNFEGNTISEEIGCLNKSANGDWWVS